MTDSIIKEPFSKSWALYIFLLILRLSAAIFCLGGYVHPDEFFQGGQELWYGCSSSFVPWEFEPKHALRSIVPPTIMTRIPLVIYSRLRRKETTVSGLEVLVVPRVFCAMLTILVVDGVVWNLSTKRRTRSVPSAMLLLASSWPTMIMLTRPFTNTLETVWFALLFWLVVSLGRNKVSTKRAIFIGMVCAMGIFTRFTFVCFALPLGFEYLRQQIKHEADKKSIKAPDRYSPARVAGQVFLDAIAPVLFGFVLTSIGTIYADYKFYNSRSSNSGGAWSSFVTPVNAFLYNCRVDNLRQHGLHPKWTHAVVNMHILFGPSVILCYALLSKVLRQSIKQPEKNSSLTPEQRQTATPTRLSGWVLLSGLVLLSLAPHQEPRFLLPLTIPVAILAGESLVCFPTRFRRLLFVVIWIVFNCILLVLFGVLHQGGVVRSLLNNRRQANHYHPKALLYFHTYMPPSFLTRQSPDKVGAATSCPLREEADSDETCLQQMQPRGCPEYPVVDLQGADFAVLDRSINAYLDCGVGGEEEYVHLVSPTLVSGDNFISSSKCSLSRGSFECQTIDSYYWHLTTEDLPPFQKAYTLAEWMRDFNLSVYRVSCGRSEKE